MNRGNRRIIVSSIILTLPMAILLGSFSTGAPPYKAAHRSSSKVQESVQHVLPQHQPVAHLPAQQRAMQQHAATAARTVATRTANPGATRTSQPSSNLTGGLLKVFTRGNDRSTSPVRTADQAASQSGSVVPTAGVLDGLVEAIKTSNRPSNSRTSNSRRTNNRQTNTTTSQSGQQPPNWDGIPFHTPSQNTAVLQRAPIRDPNQSAPQIAAQSPAASVQSDQGRSIMMRPAPRSTSQRSVQAMPASSRIGGANSILQRPQSIDDAAPSVVVKRRPMPSQDRTETSSRRSTPALSSTTSSRRSGRRSLSALDPSEIAAASTAPDAVASGLDLMGELVPKAPRRLIVGAAEAKAQEIKKEVVDKVTAAKESVTENATKELAAISTKVAKQVESVPSVEVNAKPAAKTEAKPVPTESVATKLATPAAAPKKLAAAPATPTQPAAQPVQTEASLKKPAPATLQIAQTNTPAAEPPAAEPIEQQPATATKLSAPQASTAPQIVQTKPAMKLQTPSAVTAHRGQTQPAGPPASAFQPRGAVADQAPIDKSVPRFAPIGSGVAGQTVPTPGSQIAAPRMAQVPSNSRSYDNTYTRDPYVGNQFAADPYFPPATQVTRPMRTEIATPATPAPSDYQPRKYAPVANGMRPAPVAKAPMAKAPTQIPAVQPPAIAPTVQSPAPIKRAPEPTNSFVASELPGIRVVTHGPKQIMIRQTHEFEIRVENRGSIDAEGVMVRAVIPDWAEVRGQNSSRGGIMPEKQDGKERLVWTIDELPAGSSEKMFVRLKAERSGTHGLDVDWTLMPQKSVTQVEVREPRLELTIEGPEEVVYGQSQTYRVRVLNPGDGVAPNVVFTLSPNSPTPQTQRIGDIPPGKEAQFEVELTAQDLGDLKIAGLASGDLELRAEASKTIRVSSARLEAMLTGPELKYQDTEASYNLELQNKGIATSEKITATLKLPAGVKYISGLEKVTQRGSTLQWEVSSLPPSAVRNYQFKCKMSATGEQSFAFDCKGSAAGQANVSLVTRVESIADLVMTINDPPAPAPVGSDVTYEILIRNRGSKAATDVRAIAQFSHGIEPRRVEGQPGELLTGQVLFEPIARIAAGEEVRLKVVANANRPGLHRFRSEIRSGETILVSEEATNYMNAKSERVSRRSTETQTR